MSTEKLPNWIVDLVMDLEEQEAIHPTLYFNAAGKTDYARWDWCPSVPLSKVPDEVRRTARSIAAYKRAAELDKESK